MGVRTFGDAVLVKGVPQTLFEETVGANLPGIFGGKVDLNALSDADDEVNIKLEVKYTSGGAYVVAEAPTYKKADKIFRLTPLEESYGYKLTIELLAASPSAGATLAFVITRNSV